MRRYSRSLTLAVLVPALFGLAACGGSKRANSAPASISVAPVTLSLTTGGVASLTPTVLDGDGFVVTSATFTFASSDASIATVSSAGLVCAGTWDANNIVCTPGPTGHAEINITSGSLSTTVPVYAHGQVDSVHISPATVDCRSAGQTQQLTGQAFSTGVDITSLFGPFTWTSAAPVTATVDGNGVVTANGQVIPAGQPAPSTVAGIPVTYLIAGVAVIGLVYILLRKKG